MKFHLSFVLSFLALVFAAIIVPSWGEEIAPATDTSVYRDEGGLVASADFVGAGLEVDAIEAAEAAGDLDDREEEDEEEEEDDEEDVEDEDEEDTFDLAEERDDENEEDTFDLAEERDEKSVGLRSRRRRAMSCGDDYPCTAMSRKVSLFS